MATDISTAVMNMVRSTPAVAHIVESRVYFQRIPQTSSGASVVLWVISEVAHMHLSGAMGLDQARFQIDANAANPEQANQIARAIWQRFDGYQGVFSGVHIKGVSRASGVRNTTDRTLSGSDQYRFIATQDLLFSYSSKEESDG